MGANQSLRARSNIIGGAAYDYIDVNLIGSDAYIGNQVVKFQKDAITVTITKDGPLYLVRLIDSSGFFIDEGMVCETTYEFDLTVLQLPGMPVELFSPDAILALPGKRAFIEANKIPPEDVHGAQSELVFVLGKRSLKGVLTNLFFRWELYFEYKATEQGLEADDKRDDWTEIDVTDNVYDKSGRLISSRVVVPEIFPGGGRYVLGGFRDVGFTSGRGGRRRRASGRR